MQIKGKVTTKYSDPEYAAHVAKVKKDVLTHIELEATHHGAQNRPNTLPEFQALTLNYIQTTVQGAIDSNQERFLPISGVIILNKIKAECQEKIDTLNATRKDKDHIATKLKNEAASLKTKMIASPWSWIGYTCISGISISEGLLSYPAFRHASFPVLAAVSAATGIALGVGLGAHYLGGYIRRSETKKQFYKRYAIALTPFVVGFSALGSLRAGAYNHVSSIAVQAEHTINSAASASGWTIALISILLYWLGLFLAIRFYKTDAERKQEQDYNSILANIECIEQDIQDIDEKIAVIQAYAEAQASEAAGIYEYALATECGLISFAKQAAEAYKAKNLRFRTDNRIPEIFSSIPEFQFQTFFQNIKPKQDETN
ncbi:MAG: hypothetical protein JST10_14945 [Bacteroidetes bacterium]|nr:hypothetical protein [Bacteroidota bacterium]